MKTKFILFSAMLLTFGGLQAQWFNNLNDIYWNNNVGIGPVFNTTTEPPTQTLDVDGTVRVRSLSLPAQQDNTLGRVLVSDTNGNLYWRQDTTLDTDTQLSEAEVDAHVANNGFLTAGALTGYAPLNSPDFIGNVDIDGNINIGNGQFLKGRRQNGTASNLIGYELNTNLLKISQYSTIPEEVIIYTPTDLNQGVSIYSDKLITFFRNDGNVGIGTKSPSEKLEISGGNIDVNDGSYFIRNVAANTYGIGYNTEGGTTMTIFSDDIIDFTESDNDNVIMRIKGNEGRIGIGTTSPSEKLDIAGTLQADYIKVNRQNNNTEGGEIRLDGAAAYNPWYIDNYAGKFRLHHSGTAYIEVTANGTARKQGGGPWSAISDRRLKQDITPYTDGLDVLKQINPVWYRYNGKAGTSTDKKYIGIIAQEMQKIAPYTIDTFIFDEDGNSMEYLDYDGNGITYMLINAVKEQQAQIESQNEKIAALEQLLYAPNTTKDTGGVTKENKTKEDQNALEGFALQQNVPNPFDKTTTISALIPESTQQAKIIVYNLQGLELESYPISGRGNTTVEISVGRFPSGMYLYALMADGQLIDTRKMVLTR